MKTFYSLHGPSKVPVDTFSLWNLIRDCLDPTHEIQKLVKAVSLCRSPSAPQLQNLSEEPEPVSSTAPPLLANMPSSESLEDDDKLSSEDEAKLEEEAARCHNPDFDDGIFAALKNAPAGSENFPILDKTSFTALAQALTWVKHLHDVTQDASLAPVAHSSGSSLPGKVPDEPPSLAQGSVSVSSTSSLPVSISSPLQTALFQASKQGEDISSLGFKIKKGEYTATPHNLLRHSLYTLNFLNVDKQGQTAAEKFWHPHALPFAEVHWRDPLTNQWNGPDPVLIWGRGHACVFPRDAEDPRWVPERLVRFYGSGPNRELPSLHMDPDRMVNSLPRPMKRMRLDNILLGI